MSMTELGRLTALDGAKLKITLDPAIETILCQNQLGAVIWAAYGREPSAVDWDFVIPGSAMFVIPAKGGEATLNLLVDYAGAPPAADIQAVIYGAGCNWSMFVAPII